MNKSKLRLIGLIVFGIFLVLQLFSPQHDNPPFNAEEDFIAVEKPTAEVESILRTSCYDCHSNETEFPWYAEVAPISWLVVDDVNHGREELNFSEWATYSQKKKDHKLKELIEEVENGNMPMPIYTVMHAEAELSSEQMALLNDWVRTKQ